MGWHFEESAEESWLCFLSGNEVVLRLRLLAERGASLLEPLANAADGDSSLPSVGRLTPTGRCLHLSTELILASRSFLGSRGRVEVFYESLELGAHQTLAASHWDGHGALAVGLQSGDCLLVQLAEDGVRSLVMPGRPLVETLLSGLGLKASQRAERVCALALARDRLAALSGDCFLRVWDVGRGVLRARVDVRSLAGLTGDRRVADGALSASHPEGALALGFALEGEGEEPPLWRVRGVRAGS